MKKKLLKTNVYYSPVTNRIIELKLFKGGSSEMTSNGKYVCKMKEGELEVFIFFFYKAQMQFLGEL